jgi:hypothetical protein
VAGGGQARLHLRSVGFRPERGRGASTGRALASLRRFALLLALGMTGPSSSPPRPGGVWFGHISALPPTLLTVAAGL